MFSAKTIKILELGIFISINPIELISSWCASTFLESGTQMELGSLFLKSQKADWVTGSGNAYAHIKGCCFCLKAGMDEDRHN